jgi:hypothetical protein
MDVKEAVNTAKQYVNSVFADEGVANLRLEEVEFDDAKRAWSITLGFTRPKREPFSGLASVMDSWKGEWDYKIVSVSDDDAKVLSVKIREPNG